jgi:hypothetical protein
MNNRTAPPMGMCSNVAPEMAGSAAGCEERTEGFFSELPISERPPLTEIKTFERWLV